jgi:hypothetical protein
MSVVRFFLLTRQSIMVAKDLIIYSLLDLLLKFARLVLSENFALMLISTINNALKKLNLVSMSQGALIK